jgi:hypothetical protein
MFDKLKIQVQDKFKKLADTGKLFYVEINRELIWEHYLNGFVDPVEKLEHNCNCCKSFLRQYGGIVAIVDNKVQSIWDIETDELYAPSIKNIKNYIKSLPITDVYKNTFEKLGTDKNTDSLKNLIWQHFFLVLPKEFVHKGNDSIESIQGILRENKNVLKRSLDELTIDSVETILELIAQNSLYKGKESEGILKEFNKIQKEYKNVPTQLKDNFCWLKSTEISQALTRIRNSAIGTLLINLSENMDLDTAVSKFETMVAPSNYKRPTALVTPRMVEDAKTKLSELGLLGSIERRFAVATDLDIKDILFVDKSSSLIDVFEDIKKDSEVNPRSFSKIEEIGINDFIEKILPKTKNLKVLLENQHLNNMTTLLTSVDKDSPLLFKWGNPFSWSYTGGITDSLKEKVKAAGGNVSGVLRFSIQWNDNGESICDLDAHATEPNGNLIYYGSYKGRPTDMSGMLDVDMIRPRDTGVENITWTDLSKMKEGKYTFICNNYDSGMNNGFTAQIEFDNQIFDFHYNKKLMGKVSVAEVTYSKSKGFEIKPLLDNTSSSIVTKEKWGLKTNRFHKVKNIMLSPNHWNEAIGNKHYMFILEHCSSDEATRPFFNEYLKEELTPHRKFFEVLGSKLKLNPPIEQLSGIGFSDTQKNHLTVQIEGSTKRILKINF